MASSDLGQRLDGGASRERFVWPLIARQYADIIPPFPGPGVVEFASLPSPPLLDAKEPDPRKVWRVIAGYATAVRHHYGACYAFDRVSEATVLRSKHYPTLSEAVPHFIDLKIAPLAWSAFSIHVWQSYVVGGGRGKTWDAVPSRQRRGPSRRTPPTPAWTFSVKRINERVDWYSWQESYWRGGRLDISIAHRKLATRWYRMKAAIVLAAANGKVTREMIEKAVQANLPKREYDRLKDEAETAAMVQQDAWNRAVKRGEWVWG